MTHQNRALERERVGFQGDNAFGVDFLQDGSDCMKIEGFLMGSFFLSCFHFIFVDLSTVIMNKICMHLDVMNPRTNFMVGFCYFVAWFMN